VKAPVKEKSKPANRSSRPKNKNKKEELVCPNRIPPGLWLDQVERFNFSTYLLRCAVVL